MTLIPRRWLCS